MDKEDVTHTHTHMHTLKYYSVIKKNKIPPFITWIDLEGIMFSEASEEKGKFCILSLICGI